jgi:hypothetical protein
MTADIINAWKTVVEVGERLHDRRLPVGPERGGLPEPDRERHDADDAAPGAEPLSGLVHPALRSSERHLGTIPSGLITQTRSAHCAQTVRQFEQPVNAIRSWYLAAQIRLPSSHRRVNVK